MASSQDPDFQAQLEAVTVNWYSQHNESSSSKRPGSSDSPHPSKKHSLSQSQAASVSPSIDSDVTAWQTALQTLPPEFKNQPRPVHLLAQALADQRTLRQIEWNPYRQGFVPRTPHDFASMMIFISGQVNPNPCRNCQLKNGPYAKCIVSPPDVLANSSIRHACANCTYQNQYKKCTNDPVTEEEMNRSLWAKGSASAGPPGAPSAPHIPKITTTVRKKRKHREVQNNNPKPAAQPIGSADSFVDKLQQVRAWSPRSRRKMQAEALQWQAAIATVEAETAQTVTLPAPTPVTSQVPPALFLPQLPLPPASPPTRTPIRAPIRPTALAPVHTPAPVPSPAPIVHPLATSMPAFIPPPSSAPIPEIEMMQEDEYSEVTETGDENAGEGEGDDETWDNFGDIAAQIKARV